MLDWLKRNVPLVACITIVITALMSVPELESLLSTLAVVVVCEAVAIILSNVAHYAYTCINFERQQDGRALGAIFSGVHLLVGLVVLGVYFLKSGGM